MGPVMIWPNTIVVANVFQEIMSLTTLQHTGSCRRKNVQKNVVISNIQMQIICDISVLFGKWNFHGYFIHTLHVTTAHS